MEGGRQSGREGERWETEGGREKDRHKTDQRRVCQAQPCSRPRGTGPHQAPPFVLIPRTRHGKREREGGGDIPHLNDMPDKINDSDLTSFRTHCDEERWECALLMALLRPCCVYKSYGHFACPKLDQLSFVHNGNPELIVNDSKSEIWKLNIPLGASSCGSICEECIRKSSKN